MGNLAPLLHLASACVKGTPVAIRDNTTTVRRAFDWRAISYGDSAYQGEYIQNFGRDNTVLERRPYDAVRTVERALRA